MDDSYFPTRGLQIRLEGGAYYGWGNVEGDDGNRYPYHNHFYEGIFNLKSAIPLGSRVMLIPQTWNRWLFGSTFGIYGNYIGGTRYGRYTQTQMPFIGLNNAWLAYDKADIARADLRINLFRQQYLTLYTNYLFEWDMLGGEFGFEQHFGLGAGYSINTIVGPVQLILHWSDISRTVVKPEKTAGVVYKVAWRGPDVIDVLPHGEHLRLFQRDLEKRPYLPKPSDVTSVTASNFGPTQQKK